MGNICCGGPEQNKGSAIQSVGEDVVDRASMQPPAAPQGPDHSLPSQHPQVNSVPGTPVPSENLKLHQEAARINQIVNACGQQMVAVRSTRGATNYYDQGFAAALRSHLEQTTNFPPLPVRLPPPSKQKELTVTELLGANPWQHVQLGNHSSGIANCGGENPLAYMDRIAEAYLDESIPKKEQIFRKAPAIVENLL